MAVFNIHEAKTHLSRLLERVLAGDEIIIAKAGKRIARLVPWRETPPPRKLGLYAGQVVLADDFDDLPEDMNRALEGKAE